MASNDKDINNINLNNNINLQTEENIKLEQLYNIFLSSFDIFKKYKKDSNHQLIKDSIQELKLSQNNPTKKFSNSQLMKYSLLLVSPLDKCNIECMEQILSSMEQILFNDLLNKKILQKMVNKLIVYIPSFLRNNEIDYKINNKILHICEVIYGYPGLFVHNENLKTIIKIFLRIYLSMYNIDMFQSQSQKSLSVIIQKMTSQLKECNITNKIWTGYNEEINLESNKQNIEIDKKKKYLYKLQLNEFNFVSGKYLDFLIDLIEIQNNISNNNKDVNIINKYIDIIKSGDYNSMKESLEKLNLSDLNIYYNNENNNKSNKIGKYGWCILCHKSANHISDIINFPICNSPNCFCETEFNNCLNNIYPRNDFLNMLIYLSITSTCLENIREMLEKSNQVFKNDSDVIFIIKEIFRDSLVKNTLSSNIKIFQPSLELFISIIKVFRVHLKEQIEIFFMKVLITFLESENLEFVFKDAVLKALLTIVNDCSFLVEIYVNYDCDVNCTAVFSELINILTKIMNGLYHKSKYQNTLKPLQENELINKTLDFLNKFVFNLNSLVEKNEKKNHLNENNNKSNKIGKYGWCILCRKSANHISDIIHFPICNSSNCFCETEFNNCLNNIYPRNDFLNMLIYLSITSTTK